MVPFGYVQQQQFKIKTLYHNFSQFFLILIIQYYIKLSQYYTLIQYQYKKQTLQSTTISMTDTLLNQLLNEPLQGLAMFQDNRANYTRIVNYLQKLQKDKSHQVEKISQNMNEFLAMCQEQANLLNSKIDKFAQSFIENENQRNKHGSQHNEKQDDGYMTTRSKMRKVKPQVHNQDKYAKKISHNPIQPSMDQVSKNKSKRENNKNQRSQYIQKNRINVNGDENESGNESERAYNLSQKNGKNERNSTKPFKIQSYLKLKRNPQVCQLHFRFTENSRQIKNLSLYFFTNKVSYCQICKKWIDLKACKQGMKKHYLMFHPNFTGVTQSNNIVKMQFYKQMKSKIQTQEVTLYKCNCMKELLQSPEQYIQHIRTEHVGQTPPYSSHILLQKNNTYTLELNPQYNQQLILQDFICVEFYECGECKLNFGPKSNQYYDHIMNIHAGVADSKSSHFILSKQEIQKLLNIKVQEISKVQKVRKVQKDQNQLTEQQLKILNEDKEKFMKIIQNYKGSFHCRFCKLDFPNYNQLKCHYDGDEVQYAKHCKNSQHFCRVTVVIGSRYQKNPPKTTYYLPLKLEKDDPLLNQTLNVPKNGKRIEVTLEKFIIIMRKLNRSYFSWYICNYSIIQDQEQKDQAQQGFQQIIKLPKRQFHEDQKTFLEIIDFYTRQFICYQCNIEFSSYENFSSHMSRQTTFLDVSTHMRKLKNFLSIIVYFSHGDFQKKRDSIKYFLPLKFDNQSPVWSIKLNVPMPQGRKIMSYRQFTRLPMHNRRYVWKIYE